MNGKKIVILTYVLVLFCFLTCTAIGKTRTNLIFILVDDQGYYDLDGRNG